MVMDRETSAQEKCISILEDTLLSNINPPSAQTSSPSQQFVWSLFSVVAEEERSDLRRYLHRALEVWSKQGKLTKPLVKTVCSHTTDKEHEKAAWTLLSEMSQYAASFLDLKFILDSWHKYRSQVSMAMGSPLIQILTIIGNIARTLGKVALQDIRDETVAMLSSFKLSPGVMQAAVNTLCQICGALTTPDGYQAAVDEWCVPLLKSCEQYFSSILESSEASQHGGREMDESEATCYLFMTGELSQLSPAHTSPHLSLLIQLILLATSEGGKDSSHFSQSSQMPGLKEISLSPSLRAHGYLTLGKLCLQDEDLTKKSIPQMVRELEHSQSPAIRNNIVVVLSDLAVRYSIKVDPYIPDMAVCLRDESLLVRRQTLTLLASLIQEDYVKWKGSLFFRFISTLLDEELKIFSEFCLVHLLLSRNPSMFFQHFMECVFHFNGYEKHRVYNRFKQTDREKQLFSLKGSGCRSQRMAIYTFLLSHMTDAHRFQLTAKLCQEVLGGVVDKVIPLDDSSIPVIQDTLAILTCKEIKLSSLRRNVGEELAEEGDHVGAMAAIAQTKIITQIVKKSVIENFIPIVIATKHLFEKEHSPLLKDLLLCLKELMQDFRNEVNEILAADKQLAEEIAFDLKRVEEEQKKAAKAAQTPLAATPHAQMVSPLLSPCPVGSPASGRAIFTPPRLRTPSGKTGSAAAPKAPHIAALQAKTPVPYVMSPLVTRQRIPIPHHPPPPSHVTPAPLTTTPAPTTQTPTRKTTATESQEEEEGREKQAIEERGVEGAEMPAEEDATTPTAARARAELVNTSYVPEITTPLFSKTPRISLQRAVLLSTAKKARTTARTPYPAPRSEGIPADDTVLQGIIGRVASTPEGLAESISFNVSSVVPPSPIPPSANADCYTSRRSARLQAQKTPKERPADIMMLSPDKEPRKLDKWRVKIK